MWVDSVQHHIVISLIIILIVIVIIKLFMGPSTDEFKLF
jgi:hypothetical protein